MFVYFRWENQKIYFLTPELVEIYHPSLRDDTRRRRDDTGPYHPQNIYHPPFSYTPAFLGPMGPHEAQLGPPGEGLRWGL